MFDNELPRSRAPRYQHLVIANHQEKRVVYLIIAYTLYYLY